MPKTHRGVGGKFFRKYVFSFHLENFFEKWKAIQNWKHIFLIQTFLILLLQLSTITTHCLFKIINYLNGLYFKKQWQLLNFWHF